MELRKDIVRTRRTSAWNALTVGCVAVVLAGCIPKFPHSDAGRRAPIQESGTAATLVAKTNEAAIQALVERFAPADRESPAELDGRSTRIDAVLDFADLIDAAGYRRYPHCCGSCSVHAVGVLAESWPTGAVTVGSFSVEVVFDQGPLTYVDPLSHATAVISRGSLAFTVDSRYAQTAPRNWTLALDSRLAVDPGQALLVAVTRPKHATQTVAMSGARDAHLLLTRECVDGGMDRLSVERTVDGSSGAGAVDGATGLDADHPEWTFSEWRFDFAGSDQRVTWNRRTHEAAHWDLGDASPRVVDSASGEVFVTRDGERLGPYSQVDLALFFHLASD
jgi:hypothetical protein